MPDWMSHLIIGLILAELFNVRKKSLVVLGAFMPDLIAKLDLVLFYFNIKTFASFSYFHTPLMCFLISILIAPLFRYDRLKTIILVNIGLISHFLSDLTMKHFAGGTLLFFPFIKGAYTLHWIWPEQSFYVLIASLFIYILIKAVKKKYNAPAETFNALGVGSYERQ